MKTHLKNLFLLPALVAGFNLIPAGRVAAQTFTILHTFDGSDGGTPWASLIDSGYTLYGTTSGGSTIDYGTVFAVKTDGTGFTNLHSFTATCNDSSNVYTNSDGTDPEAGLILSGGTLYGTAEHGGSSGNGTVFAVGTNGTGFTTLHTFTADPGDGGEPRSGLILANNTLYGTTVAGGSSGNGTVFKLNTDGAGFTVLHSFTTGVYTNGNYTNSDGAEPFAGLILSGNTLYGTTVAGGSSGNGTVFAVNIDGTGFTNLHSFSTGVVVPPDDDVINSDGVYPYARLVLSGNTLYGTTDGGGSSGNGTVFAINTNSTGFTNLHSFTAGAYYTNGLYTNSDGAGPYGGLVLSGNTLYGTATGGGKSDFGTVFAVNINGTGFKTLHDFAFEDGVYPFGGLVLSSNTLYGTASDFWYEEFRNGTVFSLSLASFLPTIACSTPLILECTDGAAVGTVHAEVVDTKGNPLEVFWTIDGTPFQTNDIPSGGNITATNVSLTANFRLGEHVVVASASIGQTDQVICSTTVTVHDTTPPQIKSIVATPNVLWPPNHRMVPVNLKMETVDNCDSSPVAKLINITCNEPRNSIAPDWEITGAQTLNLRAERSGKGTGRIYTILVECKDGSGNVSIGSVDVTVPHN